MGQCVCVCVWERTRAHARIIISKDIKYKIKKNYKIEGRTIEVEGGKGNVLLHRQEGKRSRQNAEVRLGENPGFTRTRQRDANKESRDPPQYGIMAKKKKSLTFI